MSSEQDPLCTPPIEESGPLANNAPLTGYEPNLFDDFHYSETTEIYLQEQSSDTMPSYLHDAELSDDTFGRALSSPLFTQERKEPAAQVPLPQHRGPVCQHGAPLPTPCLRGRRRWLVRRPRLPVLLARPRISSLLHPPLRRTLSFAQRISATLHRENGAGDPQAFS